MGGCITLVGMMGAGKSAIGAELARRTGRRFHDTDTEIETAARMSIPEIFARYGEAFFRDREADVIARLVRQGDIILATGGGAWLREENRDNIAASGISVWLDADAGTLWHRLAGRTGRPLLETADPRQTLERMMAERRPFYALADLTIPVGRQDTVESTANAVQHGITLKTRNENPNLPEAP